jgi:galactokinase
MSSSSALIVASFLALRRVNHLEGHPTYRENIRSLEDLAGYLGTIENGQTFATLAGDRGVGTFGGSQDHTAILCSQADRLSQYSFCPVRREAVIPWPAGYVMAIGVSGVVSQKTGAAMQLYNDASRRTAAILDLWRTKTGRQDATLIAAIRSSDDAPERLRSLIADASEGWMNVSREDMACRLEQLYAESERIIPTAAAAICASRLEELGRLVDESQSNSETLLGNQVPETIALCRMARNLGASAASAFGAGFGGAVWALVLEKQSGEFLIKWKSQYNAAFPARAAAASFFTTCLGPGALEV